MESTSALGDGESSRLARQLVGQYDAPAYVRRARLVDELRAGIVRQAKTKAEEWLPMVRLRLATLAALLGRWDRLELIGQAHSRDMLQSLHDDLRPELRLPVPVTDSEHRLRIAFGELRASIQTFNQRWRRYLESVDLGPLNLAITAYNRYYVLEKECLVRSPWIARRGFEPKPPFTLADLSELLPLLPELPG